jgi:hypothetical protein
MIDKNDPRLTAYVLGDLEKSEIAAIDAALESSAELRSYVAEIRQTTEALAGIFQAEPEILLDEKRKSKVLTAVATHRSTGTDRDGMVDMTNSDVHSQLSSNQANDSLSSYRSRRWLPIAVAAGLMIVLVGGGFYLSQGTSQLATQFADVTSNQTESAQPSAAPAKDFNQKENNKKANLADAGAAASPSDFSDRDNAVQPPNAWPAGIENDQAMPSIAKAASSDPKVAGRALPDDLANGGAPQSLASPNFSFETGDIAQQKKADVGGGIEAKSMVSESPKVVANSAEGKVGANANPDAAMSPPTRSLNDFELTRQSPAAADKSSQAPIAIADNALIKTAKEIQLAQTQKMIDRSNLGIMGMTVVAAERPDDSQGNSTGGGGMGARGIGNGGMGSGQPSGITIPIDKFSLQINEQAAAKAVELLAANIDPNKKRKLTFDDLIGVVTQSPSMPSPAKRQSSGATRRSSKAELKANLHQQAARQLAFNLRSFVGQKSLAAQTEMGIGGSVDLVPDKFGDDAATNRSADSKAAPRSAAFPNQSGKQDPRQFSAWSDLQLLDLDYSQVVEQLKRSLELRNGQLKPD